MTRIDSLALARRPAAAALAAFALAAAPASAQFGQQAPEVAAGPGGEIIKGGHYVVDPTHTFVIYEIGHYATTTNRGRFSTQDGAVQIDGSGRGGRVDILIDMSSINTGVDVLNRHIQSKDFLNVADYPTARFIAERLTIDDGNVRAAQGTLTLNGQTHPILLKSNRFNCYVSPLLKRQVCGGDFETTIERSRWGVTWGIPFGFEDKVRLLVQVEAVNVK